MWGSFCNIYSPNSEKEREITMDKKIDLKNVPLEELLKEVNSRKEERIPFLIKKINDSIEELHQLGRLIISDDDCNYRLTGITNDCNERLETIFEEIY